MAEPRLAPAGSLDGVARGHHGREGTPGVALALPPPCRQVVVTARRDRGAALVEACKGRGVALPAPGRATIAQDLTIVALGPGRWLALDRAAHTDLPGRLFAPMSETCSLVRTDDALVLVGIGGPAARPTLAKMLAIDLHPRAFSAGAAAVTRAGTIPVTLWQVDDTPRFVMATPRSTARSFWQWLTDSAGEFGYHVEDAPAAEVAGPARAG